MDLVIMLFSSLCVQLFSQSLCCVDSSVVLTVVFFL
jgi:hypothetical protein